MYRIWELQNMMHTKNVWHGYLVSLLELIIIIFQTPSIIYCGKRREWWTHSLWIHNITTNPSHKWYLNCKLFVQSISWKERTHPQEGEKVRMPYPSPHAFFVFHVEQKYHQPLLLYLISSWHIVFSVLIHIKTTNHINWKNIYADHNSLYLYN